MPRITEIFAFIAEDAGPDDEGIAAFRHGQLWMPMVAADIARVESLRKMAEGISQARGMTIKLVRFTAREELEMIRPAGTRPG